nr:PAS domain S-box protein [Actinomycetota bacterium]
MNDPGRDISAVERERDFRAVLQGAHEAWVAMDSGGFIIDWNSQAEATFGWSHKEAVGRVLADLIIPERYRDRHLHGLERYLATGAGPVLDQRIEIEALHREGFEFPIELTISVRRSATATYFNAFLHDITDRRRSALYADVLHAVTRILVGSDSPGRVITGLLQELGARMGWQFGAYWQADGETGRLRCAETWTDGAERLSLFAAASERLS